MASNFKIITHRNSDNLHMKLIGDFDATSAYKLVDMLKDTDKGIRKVFIHTNGLNDIYPFGQGVFENESYKFIGRFNEVVFTGENARQIALRGMRILS